MLNGKNIVGIKIWDDVLVVIIVAAELPLKAYTGSCFVVVIVPKSCI